MQLEDVKKLAQMARIEMTNEEMEEIAQDFDSILSYVGQVQEVSKIGNIENLHQDRENYFLQNIMREDIVTNKNGEYTEKILENTPDTQDGYLKVKQIL